jgi:hypothetical protein
VAFHAQLRAPCMHECEMSYKKKCQVSKAGGLRGAACSAPTAYTPGQQEP